jgi:hypothetical protein
MAAIASLISLQPDQLKLDLNETYTIDLTHIDERFRQFVPKEFRMCDAALEVIKQLNAAIQEQSSLKEREWVRLKIGSPVDKNATRLYYYDQYCGLAEKSFLAPKEKTWLHRILTALQKEGGIKTFEITSYGYAFQI